MNAMNAMNRRDGVAACGRARPGRWPVGPRLSPEAWRRHQQPAAAGAER
jgi:hypothetical protein